MATKTRSRHADYIELRLKNSLEGRNILGIGLTQIAGTHGTKVDDIVRLARNGRFSGGMNDPDLGETFHLTPNLMFGGWARTGFAREIAALRSASEPKSPIETSVEYTEIGEDDGSMGVVVGFDRRILTLVRAIDMDEVLGEPEIVLREAPPIQAVRAIYPVTDLARVALQAELAALR